ncbi:MAG: hypothetical protein K6F47_06410 [Bacteroidaceae bacterium]|nr:hypothetical protein [Bacteroidaceae bacterium]
MKGHKLMTLFAAVLMLLGVQSANAFKLTCVSGSDFGGDEGCQKLFDGTQDTKWGTWDGWYGNTVHAIFKTSLPIAATTYELVIANDTPGSPGRNWKKWSIYAANFASDAEATKDAAGWVLIDQKDETLEIGKEDNSFVVNSLTLSNPQTTAYAYYKIVVDELVGGWGEYCQMDEFRFKDYTIDTSSASSYLDFDYKNGVDADLQSAYSDKLTILSAAIAENDPDKIVPAVEEIIPIYNEINTLRKGGFIALNWTSSWGDAPGSNIIDGDDETKWGGNFPDGEGTEHVQYVIFRTPAQQPYFYKLVTGGDTERWNTRNWKTWKVFGGNFESEADAKRDAITWVLLDERTDISTELLPNKNNFPATLNFTKGVSEKYSYYKIEVTASGGSQQQMSEIYLCTQEDFESIRTPLVEGYAEFAASLDKLVVESDVESAKTTFAEKYAKLKTTTDADQLSLLNNELVALKESIEQSADFVEGGYRPLSGNTAWGNNENHTKLIDGDYKTKWGGDMPEGGSYVIFKAYEAKAFNQYMLITGNDTKNSSGRNWKTWKIWGANIKGEMDEMATRDFGSWTLIDQKENIGNDRLPAANFAPAYFSISKEWEQGYKYFMIEVEAAADGGSIQMSEFKFLSDEEYTTIRQEYVDSLTKISMALADLGEGIELPDVVKQKLIAQLTETIGAKITAVATATADNLLPNFNEAINYIIVEVPAIIAANTMAQVDGVYQISAAPQLVNFASIVNGGATDAKAVLTKDIDMTGVAWTPIGNSKKPYTGIFDGAGFTISKFSLATTAADAGLFGAIANGAIVKNFTIEGDIDSKHQFVGLVGSTRGGTTYISNINCKLNIVCNQSRQAGILGSNQGGGTVNIDRCTYSGTITPTGGNIGGFVGLALNNANAFINITNCLFDGTIGDGTTSGDFGGIVGYCNGGKVTIKNCLSIGTIKASKGEGQFFGTLNGSNTSYAGNNFYLNGSTKGGGSGSENGITPEKVTADQLASNEVVLKLGVAFRQDVGKDAYPTLDATKPVVIEISEAGYATLFIDNADLTIPEGVTASTGLIMGDFLKLNPIDGKIAAGEAVVLKGDAGVYSFAPTTGAVKAENNDLKGAATDVEAAGKFVLAKPEGKAAGFYKASEGTIKAGKAYIALDANTGPLVKAFLFEGEDATGINDLKDAKDLNNAVIYNVAGQRVNKLQKGINIVNGKKVLY